MARVLTIDAHHVVRLELSEIRTHGKRIDDDGFSCRDLVITFDDESKQKMCFFSQDDADQLKVSS